MTGAGRVVQPPWSFLDPAEVQYMGIHGDSRACLLAVDTIVNSARPPVRAAVVTWMEDRRNRQGEHLFLFWDWNEVPLTVVHSGFTSGYGGEGPRTFSQALCMIWDKGIPMNQIYVDERFFNAIEERRTTERMLDQLHVQGEPVQPWNLPYVWQQHEQMVKDRTFWPIWHEPDVVFDFFDAELAERCRTLYPTNIRAAIREAYLVVEERLYGMTEASTEDGETLTGLALIRETLRPNGGMLTDMSLPPSEREGLYHLFRGAFQYVRNPRAHRSIDEKDPQRAIEFIYLADLLLRCLPTDPPVRSIELQQAPTP